MTYQPIYQLNNPWEDRQNDRHRHCIVGAAPEYLTELCRPVSSSSGRQCLRSASRGDLIVPRFRLRRSGYRAFAVSGPHVWNSLPTEIRQSCNNLLQFKSKLKHFCSSSPEPFCGSISNEGPYKYSILLLLLLLHRPFRHMARIGVGRSDHWLGSIDPGWSWSFTFQQLSLRSVL